MSKICQRTGKQANNGYIISHSHKKNKKIQNVNLQKRRIWCSETEQYTRILVSTKALKTMLKT